MRSYIAAVACLAIAATGCSTIQKDGKTDKSAPRELEQAPWTKQSPNWESFDTCPDVPVDRIKSALESPHTPKLMNSDLEETPYGENSYLECAFHDAKNYRRQLVYQSFRLESGVAKDKAGRTFLHQLAKIRQEPKSASPLEATYSGFGVHNQMGKFGSQTALWACGNQGLTLALTNAKPGTPDRSTALWAAFEPAIAKVCGTAESPKAPTATNDGTRVDVTKAFAVEKSIEAPALASLDPSDPSASPLPQPSPVSETKGNYANRLKDCPMNSPSYFAAALQVKAENVSSRLVRAKRDWMGETRHCIATIKSNEDRPGMNMQWEMKYRPYTINEPLGQRVTNEAARDYRYWRNRPEAIREYQGFGSMDRDGGRPRYTWFCRNYYLTFELTNDSSLLVRHSKRNVFLVWPSLAKMCGEKYRGTTLPFDRNMRRVDYTQMLIEDWHMESDWSPGVPRLEDRRYVLP